MVRVLVRDVEAESQVEAIKKAESRVDLTRLFRHRALPPASVASVEYADAIESFLVDEDGDTEHERSTVYDAEYRPEGVPVAERRVVVVFIEGGVASNVEQPPDVDVHIIDFDTEGADTDELCDCAMADVPHFHAEYLGDPEKEAAPELLAALEELLEWESRMGGWDAPCWEQARAAIAKAKQI